LRGLAARNIRVSCTNFGIIIPRKVQHYQPLPQCSGEGVLGVLVQLLPELVILASPDVLCTHSAA
jgi:hypothetical protein